MELCICNASRGCSCRERSVRSPTSLCCVLVTVLVCSTCCARDSRNRKRPAGAAYGGYYGVQVPSVRTVCDMRARPGADANAAKLLANDGAARLVSAMEAHVASGEPTLQEQGCLAIEALAAAGGDTARVRLGIAGAEAAIEGARGDIVNERNKTYPDRALAALVGA